jgi:hypothetical protein
MGDQPVVSHPPAHRTAQTENTRTLTSVLVVGLEPTTPTFEPLKAVHAPGGPARHVQAYLSKDAVK